MSLVLQWAELEEARPLPPLHGLDGGVRESDAPPAPSALEEEDEEEEEKVGGLAVVGAEEEEGFWIWWMGVPSGVGSGEPCGVTCGRGSAAEEALQGVSAFLDLNTDGEGKLKKRGETSGEGDGERGVCSGRDLMEWSCGRALAPFEGRVWVLGSGGGRAARCAAVPVPRRAFLAKEVLEGGVTSEGLNVKTGL